MEVGAVAHGGHCVARLPEEAPEVGGTVVFVRHSLPGELVTVEITEGSAGDRFLRGDAVAVHRPSPDRVVAPCPFAGPGMCGGCDFQHVALPAQRRWKADVVAEQLRRLAGLDLAVSVEEVPGDVAGFAWRTRMRFHRTRDGETGLRAHRSHRVVPVDACLIQAPGAVVEDEQSPDGRGETPSGVVVEPVHGHRFQVDADGFWQVHRGAPTLLVDAVTAAARLGPGERVLDLYSGVGLLTLFLAEAVGDRGRVVAVEGDVVAARHAEHNLAAHPWAEPVQGAVERVLGALSDRDERFDVVVLDPPRSGARRPVVEGITSLRPRTVVHVACDPAAFGRDVALFAEAGYELTEVRAFDLFPMTAHVEMVGVLERAAGAGPRGSSHVS